MNELLTPYHVDQSWNNDDGIEIATINDANHVWVFDCYESDADELLKRINGFDELQTKLAESEARVVKYDELLLQVENKHPNESRHETALRYIRQAENKSHQSCGAGKSEHSKAIDDALCHGVGVMSIGVEGSKHVPHDEVFDRQQQTNGE